MKLLPIFLLVLAVSTHAFAQAQPTTTTAPTTAPAFAAASDDKISVSHGTLRAADGSDVPYTATAGLLTIKDESDKPRATMFFVAYTADQPGVLAHRPITFVFNGGPGAAAVWLHLGALGPRRIDFNDQGFPPQPPYQLVNNPQSWLPFTDLVFIDPVGTGYSRPAEGVKQEEFSGVQQDIESVGGFIRLYLTRSNRWLSPKYLTGESYGTTRAAALSEYLLEGKGIDMSGIVLISSVLNFAALEASDNNDLPYPLYIPTYTALALYHHKISAPPDGEAALIARASQWAQHDYLLALQQGEKLPADQRAAIIQQLAAYTGLPADFIDRSDLRISMDAFRKQLLNDQRKIIGRFDGRIVGDDPDPASDSADYDPSLSRYLPIYTATFNAYVHDTLHFDSDLPYEVLTGRVQPWDFGGDGGHGYLNVADNLRDAMLKNPNLKVLLAMGEYDLATPMATQQYTMEHMGLPADMQPHLSMHVYPAGHMVYHVESALKQLTSDVRNWMGGQ